MSFKLKVIFDGVFAFVPNRPLFDKETGVDEPADQVWVLAPNLSRPDLADWDRKSNYSKPDFRPSHLTVLSVAPKNVPNKWREVFHRRVAAQDGAGKELVRIVSGAFLEFLENGEPLGGGLLPNVSVPDSDRRTDPRASGITVEEKNSLWWVPRLSEVAPDYSSVREGLRPEEGKSFNPAPDELTAVLSLNSGTLNTKEHHLGGLSTWAFTQIRRNDSGSLLAEKPDAQKWNRAIGNKLIWETPIESNHVDLKVSFKQDGSYKVRLRPTFCRPREVVIFLRNKEPGLILKPKESQVLTETESREGIDPDSDFQAFFQLAAKSDSLRTRRYPCLKKPPTGVSDKPCASAFFQGFADSDGED